MSGARRFLFLQGPPGPFFAELAGALALAGCAIQRINLNGGDQRDWPDRHGTAPALCYRGRRAKWALFIDRFMRDNETTDLVLFGDCRPMHMVAHQMARLRDVRVHVFEEGYVRPHWMALERDGVNGRSRFVRDPAALPAAGATAPRLPEGLPPVTASAARRRRDTLRYYWAVIAALPAYPFFRSHRPGSLAIEALAWLPKLAGARAAARAAMRTLGGLAPGSYFLFPLQLGSDYQIRVHSPFAGMEQAVDYVLASFAAHAPADAVLLIKEHPLDVSWRGWGLRIARRARRLGLAGRVVHVAGGDLELLARESRGVVVVNSTAATFALAEGIPVKTLGAAIYAVDGIVHPGPLDTFWSAPQPPDPALYEAMLRALHAECLVRGGIASESAVRLLVENAAARLLAEG